MLRRARLLFLLSAVAALVIVATELPLGSLMRARSQGATAAAELAKVRQENHLLASEVAGLKKGSTIEQIAHQQYGLVKAGQKSYVVMPTARAGDTGGAGPLGDHLIPPSDLVPSDASLSPPSTSASVPGESGGFWHRLLNRLEFWKAVA
jgi:cell division protein FtsB